MQNLELYCYVTMPTNMLDLLSPEWRYNPELGVPCSRIDFDFFFQKRFRALLWPCLKVELWETFYELINSDVVSNFLNTLFMVTTFVSWLSWGFRTMNLYMNTRFRLTGWHAWSFPIIQQIYGINWLKTFIPSQFVSFWWSRALVSCTN